MYVGGCIRKSDAGTRPEFSPSHSCLLLQRDDCDDGYSVLSSRVSSYKSD